MYRPRHRSDPGQFDLPAPTIDPRGPVQEDAEAVTHNPGPQTVALAPEVIAAGTPARTARCLFCREPAGPGPVRVVFLGLTDYPPSPQGQLWSTAWVVHNSHWPLSDVLLHDLARDVLNGPPTGGKQ